MKQTNSLAETWYAGKEVTASYHSFVLLVTTVCETT